MLETQVGLTMLLSDRAIPYLLETSINTLLLQTLIYVRVYFIRPLSEIPIYNTYTKLHNYMHKYIYNTNIQNLIKAIYTWQRKMTAKVRDLQENGAGTCASISVHEGNDKFIIRVTRTDIIVVLTRVTKIF